jgi:hypothetical protein
MRGRSNPSAVPSIGDRPHHRSHQQRPGCFKQGRKLPAGLLLPVGSNGTAGARTADAGSGIAHTGGDR